MRNNTSLIWPVALVAVALVVLGLIAFVTRSGQTTSSAGSLSPVTQIEHIKGNPNAKVTIVEYSDFQCPACASYAPLVRQLIEEYGSTTVRLIYRHYPLPQHTNARIAAYAAEAAGRQGKFFEMHDILFAKQNEWAQSAKAGSLFSGYAESLGLNKEQFQSDSASKEVRTRVEDDAVSGRKVFIKGTPTFFINGKLISNPRSYEEFKSLIENAVNNS